MNKIIFISAGMLKNKKKHQFTSLYLNYGFLGLASIIAENHNVSFYHGDMYSPSALFTLLQKNKFINNDYPIFLSIPSFYAVPWAEEFSQFIKEKYSKKIIICGGRWVIKDKTFLKYNLKNIDFFVNGQAENLIINLLNKKHLTSQNKYITSNNFNQVISKLNYKILDNFLQYTPAIELSRGCGMGCIFCEDKDVKLTKTKEPKILLAEIIELKTLYKDNNLKIYFQSSIFNPTIKWTEEFYCLYSQNDLKIQWRCETRVDTLSERKIELLAKSGLKVIDLGLETASIQQLRLMKKTNSPENYLALASKLLQTCYINNIWTKVNILLYPGETKDTINETLRWLRKHQKYIKGISAYSLIIFGTDEYSINFLKEIEQLGAKSINNRIDSSGITKLNLSNDISYEKSIDISMKISKEFMSMKDYFDLKSFGYFPRSFKYYDFINSIHTLNEHILPFHTKKECIKINE